MATGRSHFPLAINNQFRTVSDFEKRVKRLEIVEEEAVEVDYLEVRQGTYITFASIMHVKG
jgi:hypothetical protein